MYTKLFSYGERILLLDYNTRDVELFNSMARPMKLRCVFNKVFLVILLIVVTTQSDQEALQADLKRLRVVQKMATTF